jgi:two-component system OmpR family sensor kinase
VLDGIDDAPGAPAKRRRRAWRWVPHSLTGRLVTGVVSLVVVLVLATGICTYFALSSFLLNRLDQQVQSVGKTEPELENLFNPRLGPVVSGVHAPQEVWAVAINSAGDVVAWPRGSDVNRMQLTAAQRKSLVAHGTAMETIRTTDAAQLRVTTKPAFATDSATASSQPVTVVIGLSTDDIHRTLRRLLGLETAIGAIAILVALLATSYGVRFSLRRLRTVTGTAHDVAAELSPEGAGLDRRVPVDDSDATEVGRLAQSMNTLLEAVETQFAARVEREQQMRQFLADASHELRTPLTSIRGYAELERLRRGQAGGSDTQAPDATADHIARIEAEGTRMSRLVDDLLTLARSDGGAVPRREWIDVTELLEEAVGGVRAAHPERRIELSVPAGLHVIGDPDQLVRVVRNLVTNAAVHTRADGVIGVSAVREGPWLVLQVADQGPGLPAEEAAHVFERFWRADKSRTRARGGSGLGLPIVAALVHAHGGTVRFDSSVQTGSTVTVQLPLGSA